MKIAQAPFRIDFSGGTTDIPPITNLHGAILNAAINHYVKGYLKRTNKGLELKYSSNLPTASGLGTSGTMNVLFVSLITKIKDKIQLAEHAYNIEKSLGVVCGRQDHYAAALGGINFIEFADDQVNVTSIKLTKKQIKELESHLILIYAGKPRLSSKTNNHVINKYVNNDPITIKALKRIIEISYEMKDCLIESNFTKFASLMSEEWENRKKLHKSLTNPHLNNLIKKGLKYSLGVKVCGAAGGGCVLFYAKNKNEFKKNMKNYHIIDFKFDFEGIKIKEKNNFIK